MQGPVEQEGQPDSRLGKLGFDHRVGLAFVIGSDCCGGRGRESLVGYALGEPGAFHAPVLHSALGPGGAVCVGDPPEDDFREGLVVGVEAFYEPRIPQPVKIIIHPGRRHVGRQHDKSRVPALVVDVLVMQRLMQVADEMNHELQRFRFGGAVISPSGPAGNRQMSAKQWVL